MYVNIPVKMDTKQALDALRLAFGAKSYDETLKTMARANGLALLADAEGILAGTPKFKRDSLERDFS